MKDNTFIGATGIDWNAIITGALTLGTVYLGSRKPKPDQSGGGSYTPPPPGMSNTTKTLLIGGGVVAAGLLIYAITKKK